MIRAIAIAIGLALSAPAAQEQDPHPTVEQWANYGSIEQLDAAPGIGPVMAQRIIDGRPYGRASDLRKVKGIGPITFSKIVKWMEEGAE